VRLLSLASTWLFGLLVVAMWIITFLAGDSTVVDFFTTASLLGGYFANLHHFMLPINDYHEFYLYWWFAWSIMIGQFTARFVSGLLTWQLLFAMLVVPSVAIGVWFTVLYQLHTEAVAIATSVSIAMICVGILMVVNSLDSLIRLYTDNLRLTTVRLGSLTYFLGNVAVLSALTLMFRSDFLRIEWVGALVIAIYFACFAYILLRKWTEVAAITSAPLENSLDYRKVQLGDSIIPADKPV
jgi:glycine betaine transporter